MAVSDLGASAVARGWRAKLADALAPRIESSRLPVNAAQTRAVLGFGFLALSLRHLVDTVRLYRARR